MGYHLLVVDDEIQSREMVCSCFPWGTLGYLDVKQASNGVIALNYIKQHQVDVVLCDIKMPLMNGLELCAEICKMEKKPIVVLFSGFKEFEFARKAMQYGVRYYLLKPLRFAELQEVFTEIGEELNKKNGIAEGENDSFITRINKYIENNYANASLAELAQIVHMNANYISQLYKAKTGNNFSNYLLEKRMEEAKRLLRETEEKIYTIGDKVGYSNPKNFARAFFGYEGETPKEYRMSHNRKEI